MLTLGLNMAQCEPDVCVFFVLLIASQKVSMATTLILKMVRERKEKEEDYSDTHSTEENVEKTTIISPHQSLVLPP